MSRGRTPQRVASFELQFVHFAVLFRESDCTGIEVNHDAIYFMIVKSAFRVRGRSDKENSGLIIVEFDVVLGGMDRHYDGERAVQKKEADQGRELHRR